MFAKLKGKFLSILLILFAIIFSAGLFLLVQDRAQRLMLIVGFWLALFVSRHSGRNLFQKRAAEAESARLRLEGRLREAQKLEALGTLASGVAHEINNPINGILNYSQLLGERLAGGDHDRLAEFSYEINREAERIALIVRNLLYFARRERPRTSLARLSDIVETTLSLLRNILRRDQICLEVDVPSNLPLIKCRSQQIQQVLMNLLTNSRDALNAKYPGYHPDKKIRVLSRMVDRNGQAWIRTTVEDWGTGILPEVRQRLFEPFFTTKPRDKGTGLGLAVSQSIVSEHSGQMHVESQPGHFTRFHLDLLAENNNDSEAEEEALVEEEEIWPES